VLLSQLNGFHFDVFWEKDFFHSFVLVIEGSSYVSLLSDHLIIAKLVNGRPSNSHANGALRANTNSLDRMVLSHLLDDDVQQGFGVGVFLIIAY
jgi:hypothetical protein